jgi:hypothetical protein
MWFQIGVLVVVTTIFAAEVRWIVTSGLNFTQNRRFEFS